MITSDKIRREEYLNFARSFDSKEIQLIREFEEWLPEKITDCHAHCCLPEHVNRISEEMYSLPVSSFPSFSLEESREWQKIMHPKKKISSLRFSIPLIGIDHRATNSYLLRNSSQDDKVAIFGLPEDTEYTIKMIKESGALALKSYYFSGKNHLTRIYDYFPQEVLSVAQEKEMPIILHLPTKITKCFDQISKTVSDFPRLKICIAHLGLEKKVNQRVRETFTNTAKYENIFFDTSLISSPEVIKSAIDIFGVERVLYGSDEPLNLVRFVIYEHPILGDRLLTKYHYHWVNTEEHFQFQHLLSDVVHSHWNALSGIKRAINKFPLKRREVIKEKVFYSNARSFFSWNRK